MTNERKIEILKTENEKLQKQVNELKAKTEYDKDILKYKHEQQKLLEDIRELKAKTEKELYDFYKEKKAYEKKMKKHFKLRKPILKFGIKK